MDTPKLMTVQEVAELLRCDTKTILRRIWSKKLKASKPPRCGYWLIPSSEVHRYLDTGANQ